MRKPALRLLAAIPVTFLLGGCAFTTPRCDPLAVPMKPPASLLLRPLEPVTLTSEVPASTNGTLPASTPKTLGDGSRAAPNSMH